MTKEFKAGDKVVAIENNMMGDLVVGRLYTVSAKAALTYELKERPGAVVDGRRLVLEIEGQEVSSLSEFFGFRIRAENGLYYRSPK